MGHFSVEIYAPTGSLLSGNQQQEINVGSDGGGSIDWVVGGYYYHDNNRYPRFLVTQSGSTFNAYDAGIKTEAFAAYADVTANVAPNLYLTGGLRFGTEKIMADFVAPDLGIPFTKAKSSDDSFTPRAVVRYELTPRSNVYASYSKGYKSGVINSAGYETTPIRPEKITAYEVGYKTSEGGISFEAAAFLYKYKDLQITSYSNAQPRLVNAGRATIYGAEAHLGVPVTDAFTIDIGAAYTHGEYDSFPGAPSYVFDPATGVITVGAADATGNVMQRTPEFSGNLSLNYKTPLAGGELNLSSTLSYQSKLYFDPTNIVPQKGYGILNLRAAWTDPSDKWEVAVFGRNVTDTNYIAQVLQLNLYFGQQYGTPATFGVQVLRRF